MSKTEKQLNRGRLQAQGNCIEESRSWATNEVPRKTNGFNWLNELKGTLSDKEIKIRERCFVKAEEWIRNAPADGHNAITPIIVSYTPLPPIKDVRVDGEIFKGRAFKD